jgi:hypothetical protein
VVLGILPTDTHWLSDPHLAKSDTRPTLLCTTTMYSVTRFNSDGIFPVQLFFCSRNPDNFFSIRVQFNCLCSKKYSFHLQLMGFNRLEKNCCKQVLTQKGQKLLQTIKKIRSLL